MCGLTKKKKKKHHTVTIYRKYMQFYFSIPILKSSCNAAAVPRYLSLIFYVSPRCHCRLYFSCVCGRRGYHLAYLAHSFHLTIYRTVSVYVQVYILVYILHLYVMIIFLVIYIKIIDDHTIYTLARYVCIYTASQYQKNVQICWVQLIIFYFFFRKKYGNIYTSKVGRERRPRAVCLNHKNNVQLNVVFICLSAKATTTYTGRKKSFRF